jgi:hypothetical protein
MGAHRQVLDDPDVHPGGARGVLRGSELPAGEPLQPGVEVHPAGQPPPFPGDRG